MSDGAVVGMVAALSRRQGDYRSEHVVLLGLTARILAYEWERVRTRTELRELRQRIGAADGRRRRHRPARPRPLPRPARARVEARPPRHGRDDGGLLPRRSRRRGRPARPLATLALKDAAEALSGAVRSTDQVGRVGEMDLGVAMIGCDDEAGVEALAERFAHSLRRVTHGRPVEVRVAHGAIALGGTRSADGGARACRASGGRRAAMAANGSGP